MLTIFSLIGIGAYFALLLYIVLKEERNDSVLSYFFANRQLPFWALSITFIASWWGAGSALSTADLAYTDGIGAFWYYGMPVLISTLLMVVGAKAIRRIDYLTQGDMMSARYNPLIAKLLAILIFLFMTFSAASQMVGMGDFFGLYLGLEYESGIIIGTGIVLIYSLFGGFRGVVLTDIIQFVLLLLSAIIVFAVSWQVSGGYAPIAHKALELNKPTYWEFSSGFHKYLMYVITFGCAWMIQANVWQRITAARSSQDARKMTLMSFVAYIPLYLIVVLTGMAGLVIFPTLPEGGIVPALVTGYMSPIIGSIVFVGIAAAIMSTMDSLINTAAMTLVLDFYPKNRSEKEKLAFSRVATFMVTALGIYVALEIRSILEVSRIAADIITMGMFVPLTLGFIWKRGNTAGAFAAIILGSTYCGLNLLQEFGMTLPLWWPAKSTLQTVIGIGLSLSAYIIISLCTKPEYDKSIPFINKAQGKKE